MRKSLLFLLSIFITSQLQAQFTDTVGFEGSNQKYGVKVLSTGKVLVEPKYQELGDVSEGLIRAKLNDKFGYIDVKGKEVVPIKYNDAGYFFSEGLAAVSQLTKGVMKMGFVDKSGKVVIDLKYYAHNVDKTRFLNGVAVVFRASDECGIIDKSGNALSTFMYTSIIEFEHNVSAARFKGKWALIHKSGKELTDAKYDVLDVTHGFSEGLIKMEVGGKIGFIDESGTQIVPPYFTEAKDFREGLCAVRKTDRWGYIDVTGKTVITNSYDYADNFSEGLAAIGFMNDQGEIHNFKFIDKTGKMIFAVKEGGPSAFGEFNYGCALMQTPTNEYFFINNTGKPINELKYEDATQFSEGLASVCIGGKCGYIDNSGKTVIQLTYSYASPFYKGTAAVVGKNASGVEVSMIIDKTGKVIATFAGVN